MFAKGVKVVVLYPYLRLPPSAHWAWCMILGTNQYGVQVKQLVMAAEVRLDPTLAVAAEGRPGSRARDDDAVTAGQLEAR